MRSGSGESSCGCLTPRTSSRACRSCAASPAAPKVGRDDHDADGTKERGPRTDGAASLGGPPTRRRGDEPPHQHDRDERRAGALVADLPLQQQRDERRDVGQVRSALWK